LWRIVARVVVAAGAVVRASVLAIGRVVVEQVREWG